MSSKDGYDHRWGRNGEFCTQKALLSGWSVKGAGCQRRRPSIHLSLYASYLGLTIPVSKRAPDPASNLCRYFSHKYWAICGICDTVIITGPMSSDDNIIQCDSWDMLDKGQGCYAPHRLGSCVVTFGHSWNSFNIFRSVPSVCMKILKKKQPIR